MNAEAMKLIDEAFHSPRSTRLARAGWRERLLAALARSDEIEMDLAHCEMPKSADERHLRRLLALRVGMPYTYWDDGAAQGQEHGISIDFMREPVADIEAKLRALNVARLECSKTPNVNSATPPVR